MPKEAFYGREWTELKFFPFGSEPNLINLTFFRNFFEITAERKQSNLRAEKKNKLPILVYEIGFEQKIKHAKKVLSKQNESQNLLSSRVLSFSDPFL